MILTLQQGQRKKYNNNIYFILLFYEIQPAKEETDIQLVHHLLVEGVT